MFQLLNCERNGKFLIFDAGVMSRHFLLVFAAMIHRGRVGLRPCMTVIAPFRNKRAPIRAVVLLLKGEDIQTCQDAPIRLFFVTSFCVISLTINISGT